jgi:hypothetical protein
MTLKRQNTLESILPGTVNDLFDSKTVWGRVARRRVVADRSYL